MDAIAQLALMHKAQNVFGSDGTFLSFPITPLQYTQNDLGFAQTFDIPRLKEFSLLVNLIPTGEAWQPSTARSLWDAYSDVLGGHDTQLAQSTRTPAEENQYQAAVQLLSVTGADGWTEPSPAQLAYNQFRDQMFMLKETYNAAQLTASLDPDQQAHWQDVEEPELRQQIQDLDIRWVNEGFKHEVENAQEVRRRLGAKNPNQTWSDWQSRFNPDISALTDTDGVQFYPTSFSPANALEDGSWQTFTLTRGEVEAMVKAAPAELRSRLAADGQSSDIESITLEFSSAAILRPWVDTDVFKARFWRFGDRSKQLSDGDMPPAGECPAYVSALVFARNITVQRKRPVTAGTTSRPTSATPEKIEFSQAVQAIRVNPSLATVTSAKLASPRPPVATTRRPASPPLRVNASTRVSATLGGATTRPVAAQPAVRRDHRVQARPVQARAAQPAVRDHRVQARPVQPGATRPAVRDHRVQVPELNSRALLHLQREAVVRPVLPPVASRPTTPTPPDTTLETTTTPSDQIFVLAFICKPLPQCPDPDPALVW